MWTAVFLDVQKLFPKIRSWPCLSEQHRETRTAARGQNRLTPGILQSYRRAVWLAFASPFLTHTVIDIFSAAQSTFPFTPTTTTTTTHPWRRKQGFLYPHTQHPSVAVGGQVGWQSSKRSIHYPTTHKCTHTQPGICTVYPLSHTHTHTLLKQESGGGAQNGIRLWTDGSSRGDWGPTQLG